MHDLPDPQPPPPPPPPPPQFTLEIGRPGHHFLARRILARPSIRPILHDLSFNYLWETQISADAKSMLAEVLPTWSVARTIYLGTEWGLAMAIGVTPGTGSSQRGYKMIQRILPIFQQYVGIRPVLSASIGASDRLTLPFFLPSWGYNDLNILCFEHPVTSHPEYPDRPSQEWGTAAMLAATTP